MSSTTHESTGWLDEAASGDPARLAQLDKLDPVLAAARARKDRSGGIEALVLEALTNASLCAHLRAVHPSRRTTLVVSHLNAHRARYYGIDKTPHRDTVRVILVKHGWIPADCGHNREP